MINLKQSLFGLAAIFAASFGANAENVMMHTPTSFQVLSLSPNGKWACGVFIDGSMNGFGFRWNLESGSIEMLDTEPSTAWDVANDGTVSGDFNDTKGSENGAGIVLPGYWRDGSWHHLEMPKGKVSDGVGTTISPDGHYMTGSVNVDGRYTPFIWKDGAIHRNLDTGKDAVSHAVSPDGNSAAGFSTKRNRTACLWASNGDVVYFEDSKDYSQGPWSYARNFSPDGTKLLYWGGWDIDPNNDVYLYSIYDLVTGERLRVQSPAYESDLEFFDVSNRGTLVGQDRGRGFIWVDGQGMYVDDYFNMRNVDFSKFDDFYNGTDYFVGQLPIFRIVSISEDENVLAMNYYDTTGLQRSLVVKIDQDYTSVTPVEVKASQLSGIPTVGITWKRPAGVSSVRGYNVYRDGKKINGLLPINVPYFYDTKLSEGTYKYEVSAITSAGVETRCEAITVEVANVKTQSPTYAFGRQKGVSNAYLSWNTPLSNITHKHYYDPDVESSAFYIYQPFEVELGVRFDKAEMANYAGHKLSEVSFYPMAEQNSWAVNVYTRDSDGKLKLITSQPVTQALNYGVLNTVKFDTPIDLPTGDLYVAIDVDVKEDVYSTIGTQMGPVTAGYSDLLKQKGDADFFSAFDSSVETAMSISCMSWSIDLGLTPSDADESILFPTSYNVYVDGVKVGETTDTNYIVSDLAQGEYNFSVESVYANGTTSTQTSTQVHIVPVSLSVDDIAVVTDETTPATIKATWKAPADYDLTPITYTRSEKHYMGIKGNESSNYALLVGAEYPKKMLRGYDGYKVNSFKFYPLAEALFTFMLYEDDVKIYELEVDDYTVGKWNEISVPDELLINENATYRLVLDCFDPEPDVQLMAIDNEAPRAYLSDIYSQDNGETWESLTMETGTSGNWMMGMTIVAPEAQPVSVDGYDVLIDGQVRNTGRLNGTEFTYGFGSVDDKDHSLNVDVYYKGSNDGVRSQTITFRVADAGINDASMSTIHLVQGKNNLRVEGDGVKSVTLYSSSGAVVASAEGDTIDISVATTGVYVVTVETINGIVTRKINIVR